MKTRRKIYLGLTILMMAIIMLFSSQSSKDSNKLSRKIDIKIYNLIDKETEETSSTANSAVKVDGDTNEVSKNIASGSSKSKSKSNSEISPKILYSKKFWKINKIVRKTAHVTLYALFAIFLLLFLQTFEIKNWKIILGALAFLYLYACLDETNQFLRGTRTGCFRDTLIDLGGGKVGMLVWLLINRIKKVESK